MELGVKSQIFAGLAVAALSVNVVVAGDHGGAVTAVLQGKPV